MRKIMLVAIGSLSLAACQKQEMFTEHSVALPAVAKLAPQEAAGAMFAGASDARRESALAYEHRLQVQIAKEALVARVEAVRAACAADSKSACTLLEISNQEYNGVPQGSVRVRIAPGGVGALIKIASEGGKITNSQTSAEDLAQPLADTERQLALLNLHRDRLTELMKRKDIGVSDLITVSRELAGVQTQFDDFKSQHANLRRRVDTELLTINWTPPPVAFQSAESPVLDALKSFGADFKQAIAQVITCLAYVLPWLALGIPAIWAIRWIWRRLRRPALAQS